MKRKDPGDEKKGEEREETAAKEDRCGFCPLAGSSATPLLTDRELEALDTMRGIREEASRIKKRVRGFEADLEKGSAADRPGDFREFEYAQGVWEQGMAEELLNECEKLYRLRREWDEWDEERIAAAEERMRLLGHIQ